MEGLHHKYKLNAQLLEWWIVVEYNGQIYEKLLPVSIYDFKEKFLKLWPPENIDKVNDKEQNLSSDLSENNEEKVSTEDKDKDRNNDKSELIENLA